MLHGAYGETPYKEKSIQKDDGSKKTLKVYEVQNGYVIYICKKTPKKYEDSKDKEGYGPSMMEEYEEDIKYYISETDPLENDDQTSSNKDSYDNQNPAEDYASKISMTLEKMNF